MLVSWWFLERMRNVSHKSCGENQNKQNTQFMFNKCFLKFVLFIIQCGKKYGTTRQATGENIMWCGKDAICKPDNNGKNGCILVTFRNQCFPAATIFI
jgi:hypothetical protein